MCQYTEGCMCEDGDVPMCEPAFTEWVNYVPDVSTVRTLTEHGVALNDNPTSNVRSVHEAGTMMVTGSDKV
jgi:hypothetical protein